MTHTSLSHAQFFAPCIQLVMLVSGTPCTPSEYHGSHHVLNFAVHAPIISPASKAVASYKDAFK